jgi:asparagine synthase (glutamine-hydrolysing)
MCRIAGLIDEDSSQPEIEAAVLRMCAVMREGGPDGEGLYSYPEDHLCFGHRRLAVIDLSDAGRQPMAAQEDDYVISYNGELYNFQELRNELKSLGTSFVSASDTEVVLEAYIRWGTAAFRKFSGMFAFAIWDKTKGEVILARDASGIKPVYYSDQGNLFAFASSVKALKQIKKLDREETQWPAYFLAYGHLPEPLTTLHGVKPLPAGTYLAYNVRSRKIKSERFREFYFSESRQNPGLIREKIKSSLKEAVKNQLIADVPAGVFLSGGLDSSVIALLAKQFTGLLQTNSIIFHDSMYSEQYYQDILLGKLKTNHFRHEITSDEFHDTLPGIVDSMDLPCCDGINTWFISKYARQSGLKVVLSGLGGDELFGGYPSFNRMQYALALQRTPDALLRLARHAGKKIWRRACYLTIPGAIGVYLFLRGQLTPQEIARELGMDEEQVWKLLRQQPIVPQIGHLSYGNQASWLEMNLYMRNQLLRDADVMGMAHGLEIRVPFLDESVVELALSIASSQKYGGRYPKRLLIDSFRSELPQAIWKRPKMGFTFPFREWLSDSRYSGNSGSSQIGKAHRKLQSGEMHWSQFYSLWLLKAYAKI